MRVLVLEDDADLRELLGELFVDAGAASCVLASSLEELERKAPEALGCDVAVLDVNLGASQPSGVDAYGWLRGHGFSGEVVFLTGHARSHPLVADAGERHTRILQKPLAPRELQRIVTEHR